MTVRELAAVCNVHYNTMRKWLIDSNIKKTSSATNAQFIIDDDVIQKAMEKFISIESKIDTPNELNEEFYRKIIDDQKEQIESLHKLLENQQVLLLNEQKENENLKLEILEKDVSKKSKKWWNLFKD